MKRLVKSETGQAVVEFAIILPVLLTILCGIIDFGWIYFNQLQVEHAAFEGVRYASLHYEDTDLDNGVLDRVLDAATLNASGVTVVTSDCGDRMEVEVDYQVQTLTFVASSLYGDVFTASAENTAAKE